MLWWNGKYVMKYALVMVEFVLVSGLMNGLNMDVVYYRYVCGSVCGMLGMWDGV